jgi:signal transduction histidine kinase
LREMEENLKRADRLAAVGKMAAGMAHEIRNPLASISGSIEMLQDDGENSPQHQKLMGIILREVGRLNDLIEDFLLFARPTSPGRERIHLNGLVEEILRVFLHSPECHSQIRFSTDFREDIYIQGDPSQLKQIFWNLFINAAQAMPDGGEIQITIRRHSALLPFLGEPEQVEIMVGDTGPGIREEELGKIFDPFYTTKQRGTGLGLSIVHSIVENYGGKITVRSEPGEGTTFSIFFPIQ